MAAPAAVLLPFPRPSVDDGVSVLPGLYVPEASQWLSTSSGRIASDGYSWMQAVHWVAGSGLYKPRRHRSHGPRAFGPTTVFIAQLLSELSPCRPGIEYLMRRTGLTKRAVQNHLQILRETGLLAYIVKGTRQRGGPSLASEFALMLPPAFDAALGIRTAGEGTERRMTGIAEAGRELMAQLAAKAARKVRRPRLTTSSRTVTKGARKGAAEASVTAVSAGSCCTPMGDGADGSSTAGATPIPSESKLASGKRESSTPKESKAKAGGRRTLNRVGRRFQLARELTQELDWLRGCAIARIAWVARNVADAGWTVTDVRAWLHLRGEAARVRRGSGLLAVLLSNAVTVLDTPAKRAEAVARWRAAQEAARRDRIQQVRAQRERFEGDWQAPTSRAVTRQVAQAMAYVHEAANGGRHEGQAPVADNRCEDVGLADPQIDQMRAQAWGELMRGVTDLIDLAVDSMGRDAAEQLYGTDLMRRARQLASAARSSHMTITHR
ncbi:transcriptional regulator (plasmid) [Streptomyces viridosporus]